jgi:drug/metabolite transporter (DMT)-like permease
MPKDRLLHYSHLHFIVLIAGFTAILGKLISIEAMSIVWYRMVMATVVIFIYIKARKIETMFSVKAIASFCLVGLIIALHWFTFFLAIKVSNVSITLAVISTGAFFVSFLEPLFFKRKIFWYEVVFGIMVIGGLYVIFDIESHHLNGILLALASAFLGGLFTVLNAKLRSKYDPVAITLYEIAAGSIFVTIFLLINGEFSIGFFHLIPTDWFYLFILASVCTAYAFIVGIHIMKWISPYTVMLTYNLEPVYGILLALIIFKDTERMNPQFYYGALIILVTVITNGIIKIYLKRKNNRTYTS